MTATDMKTNVGTIERALRVILGGVLAISVVVLLFGTTGFIWRLLCIAVALLSVEFAITGIRGYCPLYNVLGWSTAQRDAHM